MDEIRRAGLAKMNEVYAWEMPNIEGDPYFDLTVDHLFGAIWTRPGLSMRDKRLMTLSVVTALGLQDLTEVQVNAALENEELTEDELKEMAVFLTHYVGFPWAPGSTGLSGGWPPNAARPPRRAAAWTRRRTLTTRSACTPAGAWGRLTDKL